MTHGVHFYAATARLLAGRAAHRETAGGPICHALRIVRLVVVAGAKILRATTPSGGLRVGGAYSEVRGKLDQGAKATLGTRSVCGSRTAAVAEPGSGPAVPAALIIARHCHPVMASRICWIMLRIGKMELKEGVSDLSAILPFREAGTLPNPRNACRK